VKEDDESRPNSTGRLAGAKWFREQLAVLFGYGAQIGLARLMVDLGDDRELSTVARSIQRMASGEHRISGEMRALINMLNRAAQLQNAALPFNRPPPATWVVNPGPLISHAPLSRRQRRAEECTSKLKH
jgi:hypothetical protein